MDDVRRDARPAPQHRPPSHHRPRHAGNPARRDGLAGGWRTPGDAVPGRCIGVPRAGAGHGSASPGTGPGRRPAHRPRRPCATMRPVPVRRAGLLRTIPDGTLHPQCHGPPTVPSTVAAACPSPGVRMTDHRASVAERVTRFPVARGVDRIHGLQAATSRPSGTGRQGLAGTPGRARRRRARRRRGGAHGACPRGARRPRRPGCRDGPRRARRHPRRHRDNPWPARARAAAAVRRLPAASAGRAAAGGVHAGALGARRRLQAAAWLVVRHRAGDPAHRHRPDRAPHAARGLAGCGGPAAGARVAGRGPGGARRTRTRKTSRPPPAAPARPAATTRPAA